MPLFLSRVFGRKKHEDKASTSSKSSASPLEGKFEYVIPSPSPEKDPGYPHLSLNLPERRESRVLSSIFENSDVAGRTRLSAEQALVIVRACSQAIIARGLETLGVMHPHWHSASPATQQRLILLFIQSSAAIFESEVHSTRSSHDVAAVFRWALRHLELSGVSFGNNLSWYHNFFEAEKSASYPPKSYSEILAPQLPPIHLELLTTTLDLFSSLAAHSEANGISGSKLSKFLGLWLLTTERSSPGDNFMTFYTKWDTHGRMLEHLFLSYLRNEVANHPMPKRLVELIKHYPYTGKAESSSKRDLLPRPRFSTRHFDALFVHIDTESPISSSKVSRLSLQVVADALNAITPSTDALPYTIWRRVQQYATAGDEDLLYSPSAGKFPGVGRVLSDETFGILSLLAEDETQRESSINFVSPIKDDTTRTGNSHARQLSASSDTTARQHPSLNTLGLNLDWNSFSSSGFSQSSPLLTPLAETLLESKDSEVTSPSVTPSRKGSKKSAKTSPHQSRRSLDVLPPITIPTTLDTGSEPQNEQTTTSCVTTKTNSRVTKVELIPLDEGFIDFWNDSLLDPITDVESWPKFVVCKLKTSAPELDSGEGALGKKVEWMVVEQQYVKPTPILPSSVTRSPTSQSTGTSGNGTTEGPNTTVESTSSPRSPAKRASSPRPSLSSVNVSMKRFSFWGGSKKDKGEKEDPSAATNKKTKGVKVGELGEILAEEEPKSPKTASPPKNIVELSTVVQEGQELQEVNKDIPATQAREEVSGESLPVLGAAVVAAGVTAVIAETAKGVDQVDGNMANVDEGQENAIPTVAGASDELQAQKEKGNPTPMPVSPQESSTVMESPPAFPAKYGNPLNEHIVEPPPHVSSSASEFSPAAETPEADPATPVAEELIRDEPVSQIQEGTVLREAVTEQPTDVEELKLVADKPLAANEHIVEKIAAEDSVAAETVTEPTAHVANVSQFIDEPKSAQGETEIVPTKEPVVRDSLFPGPAKSAFGVPLIEESGHLQEQASPTPTEKHIVHDFSIQEPAQPVLPSVQGSVAELFEPATIKEPVLTTEEPLVIDTSETSQSAIVSIVQELEEEAAELASVLNEPEPVLEPSSMQEAVYLDDASEPASLDVRTQSQLEPVLVQEHIEDLQIESQMVPEASAEVFQEVESVPTPAAVSQISETISADAVVVEKQNPVVDERNELGKAPSESESMSSTPVEGTLDETSEPPARSDEGVELPPHVAEELHKKDSLGNPDSETVDNIPLTVHSNDAAAAGSPEMVPASEVAVITQADETPDQKELSESTEDVEIESEEPDTSVDLITDEPAASPEMVPSASALESGDSVYFASESAGNILSNVVEVAPSQKTEIVSDSALNVVEANPTEEDAEFEPTEALVRSQPLREPSPESGKDTISLAEVPVVDAPVIPSASPSLPSVNINTSLEVDTETAPEVTVNDSAEHLSENHLPPAPETVVHSGGTVGPALALSSSEAITTALVGGTRDVEEKNQTDMDQLGSSDADVAVNVGESEGVGNDSKDDMVETKKEAEPATPMTRESEDGAPST